MVSTVRVGVGARARSRDMMSDRVPRWPGRHRPSGMDWIHRSTRMAIYDRDGHECIVCGETENLSLDHIDDDRGHSPENLITTCVSCNASRKEQPIEVAYGPDIAVQAR